MVMHIVGNRPQFVKLAPVVRALAQKNCQQIIIHTGQHYDANMSDVFFEELNIPKPDRNLAIGSGTHAEMTGKAMIQIEKTLQEYSPNSVILYGDTDSTLAGAVAAVKKGIPIVHVEAGIRTGNMKNPEEANRIVTDHLSELLFCSDHVSMSNLNKEGLGEKAYRVGDVMYDTFLQYRGELSSGALDKYKLKKQNYILLTCHRQENTASVSKMKQILQFLEKIQWDVVYPVHPGTMAKFKEYGLWEELCNIPRMHIIPPVSYLEMMGFMLNARMILTDSGGVSKESYFANVKCILMVNLELWPDLEQCGWITKLDFDSQESRLNALQRMDDIENEKLSNEKEFYGRGNAAINIADIMEEKQLL